MPSWWCSCGSEARNLSKIRSVIAVSLCLYGHKIKVVGSLFGGLNEALVIGHSTIKLPSEALEVYTACEDQEHTRECAA